MAASDFKVNLDGKVSVSEEAIDSIEGADEKIGFPVAFAMFKSWFLNDTVVGGELRDLLEVSNSTDLFAKCEKGQFTHLILIVVSIVLGSLIIYSLFFEGGGEKQKSSSRGGALKGKEGGKGEAHQGDASSDDKEEAEPLRDFTVEQLREFNGENDSKIYISLRGVVYDCSSAQEHYGVGSSYHLFAGREASRAMAKLSFEEKDLANSNWNDLGPFERNQLDGWVEKFRDFKHYPVVGRCSQPPSSNHVFTVEELKNFRGLQEVPPDRVHAPIYIAINHKVIDVSYGGTEFYGQGGPYFRFAGIDASRALAKMSFEPEALESRDLSDLTETQQKTLGDWEKKLVKKYPVVGSLP